jgi:hypothetical protein
LIGDGVPANRAELTLNFVDLARFSPRSPLPEHPRRALVFSNYADEGSHLPAVIDACRQTGLELDVAGAGAGRIVTRPELLLHVYDIVFAKGKAAMEAMAVGSAVILCDFSGVGPMVTSARFDDLRPLNFGFEALRAPLRVDPLLREIARYDSADATRVRDLLRSRAGLVPAVENLVRIYEEVVAEHRHMPAGHSSNVRWSMRRSLSLRLHWRWAALSPEHRARLKRVRGVKVIWRGVARLIG